MIGALEDYSRLTIIKDKCNVEGGYVDNPDDSAGETNHGITVGLANQYRSQLISKFQWDGTMRNLSLDMAFWLYTTHFWNKIYGDDLLAVHPLIADKVFDVSINAGKKAGVGMLQEYLNIANLQGTIYKDMVEDGLMGPTTLGCLKAYVNYRGNRGIKALLTMLLCSQGALYRDLAKRRVKDETFVLGWALRVTRDMGHYAKLLDIAD